MQEEKSTNVNLAERLDSLVKTKGVSQKMVADETGLTPAAISNYMKGREPKARELSLLAKYFGVTMEFLLDGPEPTSSKYALHDTAEPSIAPAEMLVDLMEIKEKVLALEKKMAQAQGVNLEKIAASAEKALSLLKYPVAPKASSPSGKKVKLK